MCADRRRREHVVAEHGEVREALRLAPAGSPARSAAWWSRSRWRRTPPRASGARCAMRSASAPSRPCGCRRRPPWPSAATGPSTPARASCRRRCTGSRRAAAPARSRCRCARSAARRPGSRGRGSCDVRRQQIGEAVAGDGVGVAAAELHQAVAAARLAPRRRSCRRSAGERRRRGTRRRTSSASPSLASVSIVTRGRRRSTSMPASANSASVRSASSGSSRVSA